jgi:putative membrane protein
MKKLIFLCLAAVFAINAKAQTTMTDTAAINFVNEARNANMKEVRASRLALTKSHNDQVISFASMMINDHSAANRELLRIAKMDNFSIPSPADSYIAPSPLLEQTTGHNFDLNYVSMMVRDHKRAIALFSSAASNQVDQDLRNYAAKMLPKLKQHLKAIQAIATSMGLNP